MKKIESSLSTWSLIGLSTLFWSNSAWISTCQAMTQLDQPDLTGMSLEELLKVEVTSVSKHAQSLNSAAAAIHVISQEDIRRSGATSLPEVLRLAPGVHVGHINGNQWSVGVRGLGGRWSSQLLVLMDGRTIYSPLFSGVYWEAQNTMLEDIERIEIIRGPGGTLWGSNAVNGVINIITKSAKDSQGALVVGRYGTQEEGAALRYGAQLGEHTYARAYAKYQYQNPFKAAEHRSAEDELQSEQAGFRIDGDLERDNFTVQGDIYHNDAMQSIISTQPGVPGNRVIYNDNAQMNGMHLLGRWRHQLENGELQLQAYFDRAERRDAVIDFGIDTWDIELQHQFQPFDGHNVVWGGGYRMVNDEIMGSYTVAFDPLRRSTQLYNVFAQDEIEFDPSLHLILGSKFEINEITGLEVQPSGRLIWQPNEQQSLWGAISRVVRVPSRAERDMRLRVTNMPFPPFSPVTVNGNNNAVSAIKMLAFEVGYRHQFNQAFNIDLATFYYDYDELFTQKFSPSNPFDSTFANDGSGTIYGFELSANWQVSQDWRLRSSYSRAEYRAEYKRPSFRLSGDYENSGPNNMYQLQSRYQIADNWDFDAMFYWIDKVGEIPDYQRVDLRLAWRPTNHLELSVVGQNLLDPRHPEFTSDDTLISQVPRSVFLQARLSY